VSQIAYDSPAEHEPIGRKLAQVNTAARRLFLDQGFTATSMDAVAREAGVSKATLYSYFPSKEALFAHLIADECIAVQAGLDVPTLSDGLESALRRFARDYVRMFMNVKKNSLVRVMANESKRFPQMCLHFYETGPLSLTRRVALLLIEARSAGLLSFRDATVTATQFLSLIRGDLPLKAVLGIQDLTNDTSEAEIEAGIATFLRAYRVDETAAA
jgi:AcrR family transcriptional regulator